MNIVSYFVQSALEVFRDPVVEAHKALKISALLAQAATPPKPIKWQKHQLPALKTNFTGQDLK